MTSSQPRPARPRTSKARAITSSYKQSPRQSSHDQSIDTSFKINSCTHLCIRILWDAEDGQSTYNGRSRRVSC